MTDGRSPSDGRPAEERAEELMERVAGDASRKLGRFLGRAREEFEDIVAEARSLNEHREPTRSKPPSELPPSSDDGR